ncbi:MAG: ATP-grasp domain-containing protein [Pseudomonadota bacterium]
MAAASTAGAQRPPAQSAARLLLVAAPDSYRTAAYLAAAQRCGIAVLIASEGRHSLVSAIAGGLHIDLADPAAFEVLLAADRAHPFCGVVATDDATVELASRVAERLGLPHNPPEAARRTRRKDLSRTALAAYGAGVPEFRILDLARPLAVQLAPVCYPCVIKPLTLSGSRGVIRADNQAQALAACRRIRALLAREPLPDRFAATHLLLESFVPGPEVALEGMLSDGQLQVLALFDKPDPLDGPYFEETYYITPSRHAASVQQAVSASVQVACQALGLRAGPVHAEVRIAAQGCVIMEVAARTIGGDCARLLRAATGHGLEELVIAHASGRQLAFEPAPGAAGVLMLPIAQAGILRRIEGIGAARAVPFIEDISIAIREGYELVPLPEGASYLGFMFARAPTPAQAEAALRAAHAQLDIVVAPLLRMHDLRAGD